MSDSAITTTCHACGEQVQAAALKCRHCGVWFDRAAEKAHRRATMPRPAPSARLRAAAGLLLGATPFYLWCSFTHVCMAGHFDHPPYPWWEFANEALWTGPFVLACVLAIGGGGPLRGLAIGALVVARWIVGDVMPLDIALHLGLAIAAVVTLARASAALRGERGARPSSP